MSHLVFTDQRPMLTVASNALGPFDAEVTVPGSKSYTIRALLLAAMTPGTVHLVNPLESDDTIAMARCLRTLGIAVTESRPGSSSQAEPFSLSGVVVSDVGETRLTVEGDIHDVKEGVYTLDADLSAASLRFLLALAVVLPGTQILHGQEGLNRRPVRDLVDALRLLGAEIDYLDKEGYPPVRVSSSRLSANRVAVSGATSSQYVSALMMIAPLVEGGLILNLVGETLSRPYLDMTAAIMRDFGVMAEPAGSPGVGEQWIVPAGQSYRQKTYRVEGDASSASYYMGLATLTGSRIVLNNLPARSVQADMRFLDIMEKMGSRVIRNEESIIIEGHGVRPVAVNMQDCPDQAQTLAVLAAFAQGVTRIEGLRSLRVKETDRLSAVACELTRMGIHVIEEADALTIEGGAARAASIATYGDHRMAMAFALAGVMLPGLVIESPEVVSKTYPGFWNDWAKLGVSLERADGIPAVPTKAIPIPPETEKMAAALPNAVTPLPCNKLVLIGFMGAGKTVISQLLAERTGANAIEMDALIVSRSGHARVGEIFEKEGEARFRQLENEVAQGLREVDVPSIVSTGGGIVMSPSAMADLGHQGTVVFLEAPLSVLQARVSGDTERPLLRQDASAIEALYAQRQPFYREAAAFSIATEGKTPEALVSEILARLTDGCQDLSNLVSSRSLDS